TVLKFIDFMSAYKMNTIEIYLSEDEGWRIEIAALPELTQVGSQRGHSADESKFIQPAYGSGAEPGKSFGSGFYTRADYVEILRYATKRHVKVIPTINVPGHSRAAIKAMQNRYDRLMAEGDEEGALEYYLHDPNDKSVYSGAQSFNDNILCVCKESTVKFFVTVLDEIIDMYKEAEAPLEMFHSGGDEVPAGSWEKSPLCEELMKTTPEIKNARNWQAYYFKKIVKEIKDRGLLVGGWEEVAMLFNDDNTWEANPDFADGEIYPYVWNSLWGQQDLAYKLANAGYPVVLCNVNNFYFDLAYNKDPEERGLYWGGFVDTKKAFEFIPYDLFKSMRTDPMGKPFSQSDFEGMVRLKEEAKANIAGLQGQLWGETINSGNDRLEYYYLPKIFGLAERAWQGQADWGYIQDETEREAGLEKAWNEFANRVGQFEFARISQLSGGYNYRVPQPGAKIIDEKVHVNVRFPGVVVRYTTDGTEPTESSNLYTEPFSTEGGEVTLKAFSPSGKTSRTITIK
ncbi:MAG: family 20 glycosylhydrolase, partial [Cyclobacteriaceae bacterium]|nr:family 20 glycosylhydrolase [Cyclobacteriaceae bacterium]